MPGYSESSVSGLNADKSVPDQFADLELAQHWLYRTFHVVSQGDEHKMVCGRHGVEIYPSAARVPVGAVLCTTCFDEENLQKLREDVERRLQA